MSVRIYADNAATTRMSDAAVEAMRPYLQLLYGNASSLHQLGQESADAILAARRQMAACLGCDAKEIVFTSGGSESDNQAILSAARTGAKNGKKHIIASSIEHHAVLNTLEWLKEFGYEITLIPVHESGIVEVPDVEAAIRDDTCLATVMYANNEIGTIQPISEIGALCRRRGIPFHTDAVQAVGHIPVDARAQNIDMLSLSAHKFGGPKGIGALYVRDGIEVSSIIHGGPQERGRRAGTENVPGIMGMAAALVESCSTMQNDISRIAKMRDRLIDGLLREIRGCILNGDRSHRLPGIANFCFPGVESESLELLLDHAGTCVSAGSACASSSLEPSHVLSAIGRSSDEARSAIRISLGHENTEDDIEDMLIQIPMAYRMLCRFREGE